MIGIKVTGVREVKAAMKKERLAMNKEIVQKAELAAEYVHHSLMALTAVWMGTSLRNWIWTMDTPWSGGVLEAEGGEMDPGPTNMQDLGQEARRSVNEAASTATFKRLKFNVKDPFHNWIVSNNDPKIEQMEAGLLPVASRSRTSDMVKITQTGLSGYIKGL